MKLIRLRFLALWVLLVWASAGSALAQALPLLTISSFSWTELNQSTTRMPVTLRLDAPNPNTDVTGLVTVSVPAHAGASPAASATPGAACVPGVDFVEIKNRPFTIPRNSQSFVFEVEICGDTVFESNENFVIQVDAATLVGARCPNTSGACISVPTIVDDDTDDRGPTVGIDNVYLLEPATGTVDAVLTVRLSRGTRVDSTITFRTQSDTAASTAFGASFSAASCTGLTKPGDVVLRDFIPVSGSVVIPAGSDRTQIRVPICSDGRVFSESDQRFFVVLTDVSPVQGGLADGRGQVTIAANGPAAVGSFQISPDRTRVKVGEQQLLTLVWTVPEGKVWRDLQSIGLRLLDDGRNALWLHWNELDDSFRLCRQRKGSPGHDDDDDDDDEARLSGIPVNGCSAGALPGSKTVLETSYARLHLAGTRAVGSGPAGRQVTLELALSFKPKAVGVLEIELTAADDFGAVDPFRLASAVRVLRKNGRP